MRVALTKVDLIYARSVSERRNKHRAYASFSSKWKKGVCKDPAFIGTIGELALQHFLRNRGIACCVVDDSLNNGDGGIDLQWCGARYQVKTCQAISPDELFVRRVKDNGTIEPLSADRFVFCQYSHGQMFARIFGWCDASVVRNSRFTKTRIKDQRWFNNVILPRDLESVGDLVCLMRMEASRV